MTEESHYHWIDPELEARITALVLGEASDFERDELHRLIEQRPELATLKEQIESVHGLLLDIGTGESIAENDDWKLSAEKRSEVLAVISGEAKEQPATLLLDQSAQRQSSIKKSLFWNVTKIAAALFVAFLGSATYLGWVSMQRAPQLLGGTVDSFESSTAAGLSWEESAPASTRFRMDVATPATADEQSLPRTTGWTFDPQSPKSALSAIRDSLDLYAAAPTAGDQGRNASVGFGRDGFESFGNGTPTPGNGTPTPGNGTPTPGNDALTPGNDSLNGTLSGGQGLPRDTTTIRIRGTQIDGQPIAADITAMLDLLETDPTDDFNVEFDNGSFGVTPPSGGFDAGSGSGSVIDAPTQPQKPAAARYAQDQVTNGAVAAIDGISLGFGSNVVPKFSDEKPANQNSELGNQSGRESILGDRPVAEAAPENVFSFAVPTLQDAGQEQAQSHFNPALEDSQSGEKAAAKSPIAAGAVLLGTTGGGRVGGGGSGDENGDGQEGWGAAEGLEQGNATAGNSKGMAQRDSAQRDAAQPEPGRRLGMEDEFLESGGDLLNRVAEQRSATLRAEVKAQSRVPNRLFRSTAKPAEMPPAAPMAADMSDKLQLPTMTLSDNAFFDANTLGAKPQPYSVQVPSNRPLASKEDRWGKESAPTSGSEREAFLMESVTMPSDDDIALHTNDTPDRGFYYSRQEPAQTLPQSVTRSATPPSQARGEISTQFQEGQVQHWNDLAKMPATMKDSEAGESSHEWSLQQKSEGGWRYNGNADKFFRERDEVASDPNENGTVRHEIEHHKQLLMGEAAALEELYKKNAQPYWERNAASQVDELAVLQKRLQESKNIEVEATEEEEVSSLVESFNKLMKDRRYQEAEVVAKQVSELKPGAPIALSMNHTSRLGTRLLREQEIHDAQDESFMGEMASISERAANFDVNKGQQHWFGYVPPMLEDQSKKKASTKRLVAPASLHEKTAADEAFSTFSLHVSDVSFKLARAALARGEWPEAAKVRIEEFVNAFDYGDPMPSQREKVACLVEQSIHPSLQQRNLMRVSMRTAAAGRSSNTPLRLTFLLDNSGSMERIDRQQTVRRAFAMLAQQLKPIDQVTLISFARQPRLLADKVSGAQSRQLVQLVEELPSEGGTNIELALQLAFEKAKEQHVDGSQSRIILLTDGAVNLGNANPDSLSKMIATMRDSGIAFDAAGISAEGLNDEILEALTRQGDGRYYLLDSLESADDGFARQIAGALRPSAKNVKVQVEFNPKRVGHYKLLGFEKHRLKQEDFRNDKVDAAEMAAAEAGVAVYQFEAKPDGEGDVGAVSVRFRDMSTGQMIENRWPIPYQPDAPRPDQAAPALRVASAAALLAAKLRGEPLGESIDLKTLSLLISALPDRDRNAKRVQQLQQMIQQARQLSEK